MITRVVQMISNFYRDEEANTASGINGNEALGEYCCLGYFDAMHVELVEYETGAPRQDLHTQVNMIMAKKLNGVYNIKDVVCVTYNDTKDKEFWEKAQEKPFLFVSLINVECADRNMPDKLIDLFQSLNEVDDTSIAYYTYDHSEIAVFRVGESYTQVFREMLSLYDRIEIFKMYTVVAIREDALEKCNNIYDEIINCRLYATVKNKKEVNSFKKKLADMLQKNSDELKAYEILGNNDYLMEISDVSIKKILYCYKMGRLLTQTNEYYRKTFFKIETQFLIEGV